MISRPLVIPNHDWYAIKPNIDELRGMADTYSLRLGTAPSPWAVGLATRQTHVLLGSICS